MSRSKLRTAVVGGALIALGFAASGCASHRFVRDQVEVVDTRVTGVEGT
ncbi:MAG: flagellar motor protein MotB, partial [Brevundimonas sp. 32-68-21]